VADNAQFTIDLGGDLASQAKSAADALTGLKDRIKSTQAETQGYRDALKNLKGSSDETKKAQEDLRGKIDTLKKSMVDSKASAQILRDKLVQLRQSTKDQASAAKEAAERAKALDGALRAAGGPVQSLRDRFEHLREVMGGGAVSAASLLVAGVAAVAVGVVALTAAVIGVAASFAHWIVEATDMARTLGLLQEAAAGSAENSAAMTSQIDAMARRVPTARAELQKMYEETYRLANFSTMSGQAIQSTYEAIAQSSAAMGQQVGAQIGEIITRSKQLGVVRIGRLDVLGTGLDYEKDLVAPLAKAMSKQETVTAEGMSKARLQLQIGGLKIADGAKLVADAVNKRFGDINLRQLLALDVQWKRLKETLVSFTRGINLEPLLKAVAHFFAMFNSENSVGAALKQIVELFGNGLVDAGAKSGPVLEHVFKQAVILAQDAIIAFLTVRNYLRDAFSVDVSDFTTDLKLVATTLERIVDLLPGVGLAVSGIKAAAALGSEVAQGIGHSKGGEAAGDLQARQMARLKELRASGMTAEIPESPAHADGGVVGKPAPGEFWASVAPGETIVPKGGAAPASAVNGKLELTLVVKGEGKSGPEIVGAMRTGSFLEELQHAFEVALGGQGIPTR
jgi:peptidoglycan hydrolase CwlO-like protein